MLQSMGGKELDTTEETELNHSDGRKQRGTKEPLDEDEEGE